MARTPTAFLAALSFALFTAQAGAEELSEQMDRVAPAVNAGNLDALGGPDDAESIIDGIDGRWFTLANMVRNWGGDGVGFGPDDLEQSRLRNCADDADYTMVQEVTGPTSFEIYETFASYDDTSVTQSVTLAEGRRFVVSVDEEELLRSYGIDPNDADGASEIIEVAKMLAKEGAEIWRPSDDLMVMSGGLGIDVIGRC
ncbi:hypothetical protein [Pelagibacterium mangrovi]|uniref:hypothetical protein n=1 Tax=Pelagibacterium mangrovi TaxID=3119828 RepID=UPI002FCAE543